MEEADVWKTQGRSEGTWDHQVIFPTSILLSLVPPPFSCLTSPPPSFIFLSLIPPPFSCLVSPPPSFISCPSLPPSGAASGGAKLQGVLHVEFPVGHPVPSGDLGHAPIWLEEAASQVVQETYQVRTHNWVGLLTIFNNQCA